MSGRSQPPFGPIERPLRHLPVTLPKALFDEIERRAAELGWHGFELVTRILLGELPARRFFETPRVHASEEAVDAIEKAGYALAHLLDWHRGGWRYSPCAVEPDSSERLRAFRSRFVLEAESSESVLVSTLFGSSPDERLTLVSLQRLR